MNELYGIYQLSSFEKRDFRVVFFHCRYIGYEEARVCLVKRFRSIAVEMQNNQRNMGNYRYLQLPSPIGDLRTLQSTYFLGAHREDREILINWKVNYLLREGGGKIFYKHCNSNIKYKERKQFTKNHFFEILRPQDEI